MNQSKHYTIAGSSGAHVHPASVSSREKPDVKRLFAARLDGGAAARGGDGLEVTDGRGVLLGGSEAWHVDEVPVFGGRVGGAGMDDGRD